MYHVASKFIFHVRSHTYRAGGRTKIFALRVGIARITTDKILHACTPFSCGVCGDRKR